MTICEKLSGIEKNLELGGKESCEFNGYLEDYLAMDSVNLSDDLMEAFDYLIGIDPSIKLCVGLKLDINNDVISNRIIRYKDAFKICSQALIYPYIVYGKNRNDEDRAIIITQGGFKELIRAKGLYFCISEPGSSFEACRNEMVGVCDDYQNIFKLVFIDNDKVGNIQRNYDRHFYSDYEELKSKALELAQNLKTNFHENIKMVAVADKEKTIKDYVVLWFFIKKILYVQYMMNKNFLTGIHHGDLKEQRSVAKNNADSVPFLSYFEMWR